jgi:hypothetical protein
MSEFCTLCELRTDTPNSCRLGRAAFCMEELILINPHHYLYHLKYAEVCMLDFGYVLYVVREWLIAACIYDLVITTSVL